MDQSEKRTTLLANYTWLGVKVEDNNFAFFFWEIKINGVCLDFGALDLKKKKAQISSSREGKKNCTKITKSWQASGLSLKSRWLTLLTTLSMGKGQGVHSTEKESEDWRLKTEEQVMIALICTIVCFYWRGPYGFGLTISGLALSFNTLFFFFFFLRNR